MKLSDLKNELQDYHVAEDILNDFGQDTRTGAKNWSHRD